MNIKFEKEELIPHGGRPFFATIEVYADAYDTSFAYAFGSQAGNERSVDMELTLERVTPELPPARYESPESRRLLLALAEEWLTNNEARVKAAWRKACGE